MYNKTITSDSEASADSDKENYYNLSQLKTIESEIEKLHKTPNFEQKNIYNLHVKNSILHYNIIMMEAILTFIQAKFIVDV